MIAMGFDLQTLRFVLDAKRHGVDFSSTATLGRQTLALPIEDLRAEIERYHLDGLRSAVGAIYETFPYSDGLLRALGARQLDAIDVSAYEHASILADMNRPLPDSLHSRFTTVIDGGTLEHIFDVPQAFRNVAALLRVGGHFISVNGTNNFMGHGFYQFSPELFFRVLSADNGFELDTLVLSETHRDSYWYEAADPAIVRARVEVVNGHPTYVMVRARKVADTPLFAAIPQQSDYRDQSWRGTDIHAPPASEAAYRAPLVHRMLRRTLPRALKLRLRALNQAARNAYASPHLRKREP
jgi:SAM-dependent methyltransferase